jgi:hypothetical protein
VFGEENISTSVRYLNVDAVDRVLLEKRKQTGTERDISIIDAIVMGEDALVTRSIYERRHLLKD